MNSINDSIPSENNVVNNQYMQNNENNAQNSNKSSFSLSENSSKDNQGRDLTKGQQEYFKDSKVRDENGRLKEVYHGTPYQFNTFNYDKLGENTSSLGAGFYFTDDIRTANEYKKEVGNLKKVYLDIKKPLKYKETSITKDEYKKFINAINDETNGRFIEDYGSIEDALMEYDYGGDDIDLVSAARSASGLGYEKTFEILKNSIGYDGIIAEKGFLNPNETIYVVFNANQIKNIDNLNPTENKDIRYSQNNDTWQKFLDDNFNLMPNATRTIAQRMQQQIADDVDTFNMKPKNGTQKNIEKNQDSIYSNIKVGEVKKVSTDKLLQLYNGGGFRTQEQINELRNSIKKNGITAPIELTRENDGTIKIENGNHRLQIAKELGIKEVPVTVVESWNNVISDIAERGGKDNNDRIEIRTNMENGESRSREGLLHSGNELFENRGRSDEDVRLLAKESNSNKLASSKENKGNSRKLENSEKGSFSLQEEIRNNNDKTAKLLEARPINTKKTKQQKLNDLITQVVNKGHAVDKLAKKSGNKELMYKYDKILSASAAGNYVVGKAQTDNNGKIIGKSINEIWSPVEKANKVQEFSEYLLHKLNVERMSLKDIRTEQQAVNEYNEFILEHPEFETTPQWEIKKWAKGNDATAELAQAYYELVSEVEKQRNTENKPVFGDTITADISREAIRKIEKNNPEFIEWEKDVNTFNKNQLQNMVDAGLTSQETQEILNEIYDHYIRIQRDLGGSAPIINRNGKLKINSPIKKATGGNSDILPLKDSMAQQAIEVKKAIARNQFGLELLNTFGGGEQVKEYGNILEARN